MHLPWGKIALGILVAVVAFGGALWALNLLWPDSKDQRPALVNVPPLKPVARNSVIVTPVAIALSAIHSALETAAPRNLAGKRDNPFPQMLSNSELDWTVTRGPLAVAGRSDALSYRLRFPEPSVQQGKSPARRATWLAQSEVCLAAASGKGYRTCRGKHSISVPTSAARSRWRHVRRCCQRGALNPTSPLTSPSGTPPYRFWA